jgi:predicted branched-subunit amino acid permease
MRILRNIVMFWVDFIVGDAWEVALGLGLTLLIIGVVVRQWGGERALSFVLVAAVIAVTWLALMRATAGKRRAG